MNITKEEIEHIAHLSRLKIKDNEIETFMHQFNNILDYFKKLQEVDTSNVEVTSCVISVNNVFRDDEDVASVDKSLALSNADKKKNDYFIVPKIIE